MRIWKKKAPLWAAELAALSAGAFRAATVAALGLAVGIGLLFSSFEVARADVWEEVVPPSQTGPRGSDPCALAIASKFAIYGYEPSFVFSYCEVWPNSMAEAHFENPITVNGETAVIFHDGFSSWRGCDSGLVAMQNGAVCVNPNSTPPSQPCEQKAKSLPCTTAGEPVDVLTGQLYEDAIDYQSDGPFRLRFSRSYTTTPRSDIFAVSMFSPGGSGKAAYWRSNFEAAMKIVNAASGSYPPAIELVLPGNREFLFTDTTGLGNYAPASLLLQYGSYVLQASGGTPQTLTVDKTAQTATLIDSDGTQYSFRYLTSGSYATKSSTDTTQLASIAYRGGYVQTLTYDATTGYLTAVSDNFGRTLGFQYGSVGQLNTLTANGATVATYTYVDMTDTSVLTSSFPGGIPSNLLGQVLTLGSVTRTGTGETTTYSYGSSVNRFLLTGITDARGVAYSSWTYDSSARVLSNTLASEAAVSLAYNSNGTVSVTNQLGEVKNYSLTTTSHNNLVLSQVQGQATGSLPASTTTLQYDSKDFVSQVTDAAGRVTTYVNDPTTGLPTSITRGAGTAQATTVSYTWNTKWRVPTQVVEPGRTTTYAWNASGQLTSKTIADTTTTSVPYSTNGQTRTWSYAYNSKNLLASVTDPVGGVVSYAYNSNGYLQTITDQLGRVTTVTAWNALGQPTSITDPNGVVDALGYDGDGRLTSISLNSGGAAATTTLAYDAVGDITKITEPNGAWSSFTYDGARRVSGVSNADGDTVAYTRDAMGNATGLSVTSGATGSTAFSKTQGFDALGRLIQSVGASSQTYSFGYDVTDNLTSITDPSSHTFANGFDALNRLITQTNEDSATVTLTRNGVDAVVGYADPRSLTTSYVRNGFGEVIQESSPDRGATVYQRDARGLITQRTDARGVSLTYTYDAAWRIVGQQNYAQSSDNVWYAYDEPLSGSYSIGRLTDVYDVRGILQRFYDQEGHVWQESRLTGSAPWISVTVGYDASGNLQQMFLPSGRHIVWNRDSMGRVSQVAVTGGTGFSGWVTVASPIVYSPNGRPASLTFGNGLIETYGNDTDGRINSVKLAPSSGGAVINRSLTWTGQNLNGIADAVTSANSETFGYTPSHRLSSAAGAYGSLSWAYDADGNRARQVSGATTQTYAYPSGSNRLSSISQGGSSVRTFAYDAVGNQTNDIAGATSITRAFDARSRLASIVNGSTTTGSYSYDGFDRLTQRVTASGTTQYYYDPLGHLVLETDGSGNSLREYIWLDDMPIGIIDGVNTASPTLYYVHVDHLNRPIKATNASGAAVWSAVWSPFGAAVSITGTLTYNARFPGQWFQLEDNLHWNLHRHYDPSTGRYIQVDPLAGPTADDPSLNPVTGETAADTSADVIPALLQASTVAPNTNAILPDGPSRYGYVRQQPTGLRDPYGTTAAGGLYWAGSGGDIGAAIGEFIDPVGGGVPGYWIGAGLGAIAGDWWTGPDTLMSEGFWDGLQPCKGRPLRTNGLPGKKRRFYEKDKLHKDHLEGYNGQGQHIGEFDPNTGEQTGPAVPGRSTDVP